jgi:hypothetical protein
MKISRSSLGAWSARAVMLMAAVAACRTGAGAVDDAGSRALAPARAPAAEPEDAVIAAPVQVPAQEPEVVIPPSPPLTGIDGAASALGRGDPLAALKILAEEPDPVSDGEERLLIGAIKGRAARLTGDPARAVAALESIAEQRRLAELLPPEIVLMELARALEAWAASGELPVEEADRRRRQGIKALARASGQKPIRTLAAIRVAQARLAAAVDGGSKAGQRGAALQAIKALRGVIADYPEHPEIGALMLAEAQAQVRAGKLKDGAAALRSLAIRRAGSPEAAAATAAMQSLAEEHYRGRVAPFSLSEELARAEAARGLRYVELSRSILDKIIETPTTPPAIRSQARRSRAWTAYKQRDFATCVADLKATGQGQSGEGREFLSRCLDRGGFYDEAMALWTAQVPKKGPGGRPALWSAIGQAVRGGRYEEAAALLGRYERQYKGLKAERAWLEAWVKMRLGQRAAAIEGLAQIERTQRAEATRASYFRGRLLLESTIEEERAEGQALLREMVGSKGLEYYGLMARQRLLDAGIDPGPAPELRPIVDESAPIDEAATRALLRRLSADFGEELPGLRRAAGLLRCGYVDEARRELRVAIDEFLLITSGSLGYEPHHEDRYVGLSWRRTWQQPKLTPSRPARARLRRGDEGLRAGLRALALALDEPHRVAKLSTQADGPSKSRWYPRAFRAAVEREAAARGFDPSHLWALMYTESRFRQYVLSPVGARGPLQIMPWTGTQLMARLGELEDGALDADQLFEIDVNVRLAAFYVAELLAKFHGQAAFAYGSYNGGPSNIARWLAAKSSSPQPLTLDVYIEEVPFAETGRYMRRVLETQAIYSLLYQGALPRWTNAVDPRFEQNIDF